MSWGFLFLDIFIVKYFYDKSFKINRIGFGQIGYKGN